MASVTLKDVVKRYDDVTAVDNMNLEIEDGEFVCLVGPSGCGKSTTMETIAGLTIPTEGQVFIGDREVTNLPPKDRGISMVFQNIALFPHMDVYDNISFGLRLRDTPKDEVERRVQMASDVVQLEGMLDRMPDEMSGGQRQRVAIESKLPLNAIDIESQKDMESGRYHALRSLHKWFAARPTPAVRLAVLASVYPGEIDSDELLRLMKIGPKEMDTGIADFVEKKFTEKKGSGTLDDHYGYPNPNRQSPTEAEIEKLQSTLRDAWGGELPTILDPTAGRGIIPFEAIRYGIPAKANELNPVPSLILKAGLEYAPEVGSLDPDIREWRDKILQTAKENIEPYYPTEEPGRQILNSAMTYIIECDSCGGEIPLVAKWWLNKDSNGGDAILPVYENKEVEYTHVRVESAPEWYNPEDAPLKGQSAECPHCDVVNEKGEVQKKLREDEFRFSIYGVNYETAEGDRKYRAGSKVDQRGIKKAAERIESDFGLLTFLSEPVDVSSRISDPSSYGMNEWRDIFTPRQLVVQYEFLKSFESYKDEIQGRYDEEVATAILTVLTLAASRSMNWSCRKAV